MCKVGGPRCEADLKRKYQSQARRLGEMRLAVSMMEVERQEKEKEGDIKGARVLASKILESNKELRAEAQKLEQIGEELATTPVRIAIEQHDAPYSERVHSLINKRTHAAINGIEARGEGIVKDRAAGSRAAYMTQPTTGLDDTHSDHVVIRASATSDEVSISASIRENGSDDDTVRAFIALGSAYEDRPGCGMIVNGQPYDAHFRYERDGRAVMTIPKGSLEESGVTYAQLSSALRRGLRSISVFKSIWFEFK